MTMAIKRDWYEVIKDESKTHVVESLKEFLEDQRAVDDVFPPADLVFNAFALTPYEKVKVVIMGQDPYHGPGQAHGLSFSVPMGVAIPPSLRNIYKELHDDLGCVIPPHGCLEGWAKQGVLLLNATLTVRSGAPKSHYGYGWELFTDRVIDVLSDREDPLVFVLWGKSAQEKCERILNLKQHPHLVLKSAHPSPFSATRFFGSHPFSKINRFLESNGREPINWQL
ncbi:MAG: uracil-DNA glycosylase [Simkaniaceae bacterium]|nr:uracil-DNA glycosylase [Simkaniaceae bacterium]